MGSKDLVPYDPWADPSITARLPSDEAIFGSTSNPVTVKIPDSLLEKLGGKGTRGMVTRASDPISGMTKDVILLGRSAPLSTRLHELAHISEGHKDKMVISWVEHAQDELDAHIVSNLSRGKDSLRPTDIDAVARQIRAESGFSPARTMDIMREACKGLPIREWVWTAVAEDVVGDSKKGSKGRRGSRGR